MLQLAMVFLHLNPNSQSEAEILPPQQVPFVKPHILHDPAVYPPPERRAKLYLQAKVVAE